jgi:hypothetical protein
MLMIPTGVVVTLKQVVSTSAPVVKVTTRAETHCALRVFVWLVGAPAAIVTVPVALMGLVTQKLESVTPSPETTGTVEVEGFEEQPGPPGAQLVN